MLTALIMTAALAEPVVIARVDIPPGHLFQKEDLEVIDVEGLVGTVPKPGQLLGAVATEQIYRGEAVRLVRTSKTAHPRGDGVVNPYSRGHSVWVVDGANGLTPRTEVDIWWRKDAASPMCRLMQRTYLYNVAGSHLLLKVDPPGALRLEHAEVVGELVAFKRSKTDESVSEKSLCPSQLWR